MDLGFALIQGDLISRFFPQLQMQRLFFQVRSHLQVLGVKAWTQLFLWGIQIYSLQSVFKPLDNWDVDLNIITKVVNY